MTSSKVNQSAYPAYPEGAAGSIRLNRRGEAVGGDWIDQLVADGRCFIVSNQAMETARDIGFAGYVETEASIAIDVATGTTLIPLEIMMYQGGTAATADVTVLFTLDDAQRITSGNALTPRNYLINATEPNTSTSTVKFHDESGTDMVVVAPGEDTTFYAKMQAYALVGGDNQDIHWSAREYIAPHIKGPGSLVIYWYGTGEPEGFYHIVWAEIPTANA